MRRCLQLAELGEGFVFPNPMVGAVIVHEDRIIGEGYHRQYGEAHAEVNAVRSVSTPEFLADATLYVSLEPCCHWGKTPPCTGLILDSGIKKVVVGCEDPHALVAGKGIALLREQGIEVRTGVLERECQTLNRWFFNHIRKSSRVDYTLKWAETADGFMGKATYENPSERAISNRLVSRFVHQLRTSKGAVMVGTQTALTDDPILDNRYWKGTLPEVVLIDRRLKVPPDFKLFKPARRVIVLNEIEEETEGNQVRVKMNFDPDPKRFWAEVNERLSGLGIQEVLLEGGSRTISSFLESGLPAEVIRIRSGKIWGSGIQAPSVKWPMITSFPLGNNWVEIYQKDVV